MRTIDKVRTVLWIVLSNKKLLRRLLMIALILTATLTGYTVLAYGDDDDDGREPDPSPYPL